MPIRKGFQDIFLILSYRKTKVNKWVYYDGFCKEKKTIIYLYLYLFLLELFVCLFLNYLMHIWGRNYDYCTKYNYVKDCKHYHDQITEQVRKGPGTEF